VPCIGETEGFVFEGYYDEELTLWPDMVTPYQLGRATPGHICPRYRAGDLCYLREKWAVHKNWDEYRPSEIKPGCGIWYEDHLGWKYDKNRGKVRPARSMCRWMARRWVRITRVLDPHRVQDISEEDIKKEMDYGDYLVWREDVLTHAPSGSHIASFRETFIDQWESIHGPGAWERNEWVVPYEYKMEKK